MKHSLIAQSTCLLFAILFTGCLMVVTPDPSVSQIMILTPTNGEQRVAAMMTEFSQLYDYQPKDQKQHPPLPGKLIATYKARVRFLGIGEPQHSSQRPDPIYILLLHSGTIDIAYEFAGDPRATNNVVVNDLRESIHRHFPVETLKYVHTPSQWTLKGIGD